MTIPETGTLALAQDHDLPTYAGIFKQLGRIHIPAALSPASATKIEAAVKVLASNETSILESRAPFYASDLSTKPVAEFLNGTAFTTFLRTVAGNPGLTVVSARALRQSYGHNLALAEGSVQASLGFELNLTRGWRPDWGGVLVFLDQEGNIVEGYSPTFNALSLFATRQPHMVTQIASFARGKRLAITGLLNTPS